MEERYKYLTYEEYDRLFDGNLSVTDELFSDVCKKCSHDIGTESCLEVECTGGIFVGMGDYLGVIGGAELKDMVNPDHYKMPGNVEVYDIIGVVLSRKLGLEPQSYADLSNIIKYLLRLGAKDGVLQEIKKAKWYFDELVNREESK
jgi:hypothetical protein